MPLGTSLIGCFAHLYSMHRLGLRPTGQRPSEYARRTPFAQTTSSGISTGFSRSCDTGALNHAAASSPPFSFCGGNARTTRPSMSFHANETVMSSPSNVPSGMLRTSASSGSPAISSFRYETTRFGTDASSPGIASGRSPFATSWK